MSKKHETIKPSSQNSADTGRYEPFNDATKHARLFTPSPSREVDMSTFPKPIQYIGYFLITSMALGMIAMIILFALQGLHII